MRRQSLCIPLIPLVLFLCLSGCQGSVQENNLALALRADFLAMDGCSGTMDITADYGERVYEYTVSFSSTQEAGITATIAEGQTYLTFDGVQLETGPLNEEGLSPLDALPAFLTAMQSGYMAETGSELLGETETLRICCREPEREPGQGIETILWFDQATKNLLQGELRSEGTTVVRCVFSSFALTQKTTEKG